MLICVGEHAREAACFSRDMALPLAFAASRRRRAIFPPMSRQPTPSCFCRSQKMFLPCSHPRARRAVRCRRRHDRYAMRVVGFTYGWRCQHRLAYGYACAHEWRQRQIYASMTRCAAPTCRCASARPSATFVHADASEFDARRC